MGALLLIGAVLLIRREAWGTTLAYFGLLLALTVLDLLVFYFDQFSAILTAIVQFGLLMALLLYRSRYLASQRSEEQQERQPRRSQTIQF